MKMIPTIIDHAKVNGLSLGAVALTGVKEWMGLLALGASFTYSVIKIILALKDKKRKLDD